MISKQDFKLNDKQRFSYSRVSYPSRSEKNASLEASPFMSEMKKMFFILSFAGILGLVTLKAFAAASPVREQAVTHVGTGSTLSVSATVWTKAPATSTLTGRTAILVNNPSSNSYVVSGILSTNSSSPTEATTIRPLEFAPSTGSDLIPVGDGVFLYLLSPSGAQNVHVQEVGQ